MVLKMGLQLPKFLQAISAEHEEIEKIITKNKIDLVISDNRYGCWSAQVPAVFITHQSNVMMPKRFGWLSRWVRMANETSMHKFPVCWIPDYPDDHSLAGELISFGKLNYKGVVDFIGTLSRFSMQQLPHEFDVVAICSGPEPQRTLLENILTDQLGKSEFRFLLIRGVVDNSPPTKMGAGEIISFAPSETLQRVLAQAKVVIARSGYSTVMDMKALQKKVIFIPTPGQTEQEYLAWRLKEKGIASFMKQHEFILKQALLESENYSGFTPTTIEDGLLEASFLKLEKSLWQ